MISLMSQDASISVSESSSANNLCAASILGPSGRSEGSSESLIAHTSAACAFSTTISAF